MHCDLCLYIIIDPSIEDAMMNRIGARVRGVNVYVHQLRCTLGLFILGVRVEDLRVRVLYYLFMSLKVEIVPSHYHLLTYQLHVYVCSCVYIFSVVQ